VKAVSLHQPWASAIALGFKRIETRSWGLRYRGPLLIHAAQTVVERSVVRSQHELWSKVLAPTQGRSAEDCFLALPFGYFVAVADLVDCVSTNSRETLRAACARAGGKWHELEPHLGNYEPHRFAWILSNVRALPRPVPGKATQGIFEVELPAGAIPA
jgi:activating signal cointegrator 1